MRTRRVCVVTTLSVMLSLSACEGEPESSAIGLQAVAANVEGVPARTVSKAKLAAYGEVTTPPKADAKKPPKPAEAAAPAPDAAPKPIEYAPPFNGKALSTTTTATGLKIEEFVVGKGAKAVTGGEVVVHYTGWTSLGNKFDSSFDRNKPLTIPIGVGGVIKGWDEGIVGMRAGGKRRLTIPADLAYGDRGFGNRIPPNSTLIFVVELVEAKEAPPPPAPETAFAGAPMRQWKTPEGIEVFVYKEGKGPGLKEGDNASIHYTGKLQDGTLFDSSVPRRNPFKFPLGQGRVIKGWDLGAQGMKVGELRKLVIPSELAYGERERPKIPANSPLTFTMELMDIG